MEEKNKIFNIVFLEDEEFDINQSGLIKVKNSRNIDSNMDLEIDETLGVDSHEKNEIIKEVNKILKLFSNRTEGEENNISFYELHNKVNDYIKTVDIEVLSDSLFSSIKSYSLNTYSELKEIMKKIMCELKELEIYDIMNPNQFQFAKVNENTNTNSNSKNYSNSKSKSKNNSTISDFDYFSNERVNSIYKESFDKIFNLKSLIDFQDAWIYYYNNLQYLRHVFSFFESKFFNEGSTYSQDLNLWKIYLLEITKNFDFLFIDEFCSNLIFLIQLIRIYTSKYLFLSDQYKTSINSEELDSKYNEILKTLINFTEETDLYTSHFAEKYNKESRHFFDDLSKKIIKKISINDSNISPTTNINLDMKFFYSIYEKIVNFEINLSKCFSNENIENEILSIFNDSLIVNNKSIILSSCFNINVNVVNNINNQNFEIYNSLNNIDEKNVLIKMKENHSIIENSISSNITENNLLNLNLNFSKYKSDIIYFFNKVTGYNRSSNNRDMENSNSYLNQVYLSEENLLNEIYKIFNKVNQIGYFKEVFSEFIKQKYKIISHSIDYYMPYLCLFKHFCDQLVTGAFDNSDNLKGLVKDLFFRQINTNPFSSAELYAIFLNRLSINKLIDKDSYSILIDKFFQMFKILEAKDMFLNILSKNMYIRLIYNLSDLTIESILIERLRLECGNAYVSTLEEMISDIKISNELSLAISASNSNKIANNIELNVKILNSSVWNWIENKSGILYDYNGTIKENSNFYFDSILSNIFDTYKKANKSKKIDWRYQINTMLIKFNFDVKKKKFIWIYLTYSQFRVLNLFNNYYGNKNERNYIEKKDLKIIENMNEVDLFKILKDLVNKDILSVINDKYYISDKYFRNDDYKIYTEINPLNIHNLYELKSTISEYNLLEEKTIEDRKPVIDSLIMKTLKHNKVMSLTDLIGEVGLVSKFLCDDKIIEERIKYLLSSEMIYKDDSGNLKYFQTQV